MGQQRQLIFPYDILTHKHNIIFFIYCSSSISKKEPKKKKFDAMDNNFFVRGEEMTRDFAQKPRTREQDNLAVDEIAEEVVRQKIKKLTSVKPTKRWPEEDLTPPPKEKRRYTGE